MRPSGFWLWNILKTKVIHLCFMCSFSLSQWVCSLRRLKFKSNGDRACQRFFWGFWMMLGVNLTFRLIKYCCFMFGHSNSFHMEGCFIGFQKIISCLKVLNLVTYKKLTYLYIQWLICIIYLFLLTPSSTGLWHVFIFIYGNFIYWPLIYYSNMDSSP